MGGKGILRKQKRLSTHQKVAKIFDGVFFRFFDGLHFILRCKKNSTHPTKPIFAHPEAPGQAELDKRWRVHFSLNGNF